MEPIQKNCFISNIYIVLSRTGTITGRMISECIKLYRLKEIRAIRELEPAKPIVPYSHASISLDKRLSKMHSFARKEIKNPFNAGFIQEDIKAGMFAKKHKTQAAVFEIGVTTQQMQHVSHSIQYFSANREKYRYNFVSFLSALVGGIKMELNHKYCCSQFVAQLLMDSRIQAFERDISVITPFDLYYTFTKSGYKKIYEGLLSEYIYYSK